MKITFEHILINYLPESRNEFRNNNVANFLRNNASETIEKRAVFDTRKYKVEGSPGKGNWAKVPWIGIFDKNITTTARGNIYCISFQRRHEWSLFIS